MGRHENSPLPPVTADQRRAAAGQFERANQVIAKGDYEYGIKLLLSCCLLDPSNLIYRQALRRTEKTKYKNRRGHWLAWLLSWPKKARIKAFRHQQDWLKVLEFGEQVLLRNPWDAGVQLDMADACDHLDLLDMAIWTLEQARQTSSKDRRVNRALAKLYEKRGNFTQAMTLWHALAKEDPTDAEASRKASQLAASETIARGNYEQAVVSETLVPRAKTKSKADETQVASTIEEETNQSAALPNPGTDRFTREAQPLLGKLAKDPTNPHVYLQLSNVYRKFGKLDSARELLQQGLSATGKDFALANELLDVEIEPLRLDLQHADEKLQADPRNEEARKLQRRLTKEILSRELEMYRQKSDRYPTDLSLRFELGFRLYRLGQLDEAIKELQTARADSKHPWRPLLYLGLCFKQRNNWRLAKRNLQEALQALPSSEPSAKKEVLYHLATGNADANDLSGAVEVGSELANLDFTYGNIGRLLDDWQEKLQQA